MKVYGLTGGVGMGKSAAAQFFLEQGLGVIDTDVLARELVQPRAPALLEIQKVFGDELVDAAGHLRRDRLAQIVFADSGARQKLEQILHPRIRARWKAQVNRWREEPRACAVVVIPLLFETGAETEFDATICVACSAGTQRLRLRNREWNDEQITQRIAAQWPIGKKMERADYVVWTEGSFEITNGQLRRIVI